MATVRDTSTENKINIVTTTENNVTVTQPSIQTVEVLTGPQGPAGSSGSVYSNSTTATYTSANILALDEVTLLSTPSSGTYYEYKLIIEYNFGTIPYSISGFGGGLILISSLGRVVSSLSTIPTSSANSIVGFAQGVTELDSALKMTLRGGSTITNGDGDLSIKIQYNIATFG
tara:strand:- start:1021 stop:1539 length:519 start_codon:yes stop_codon:yes gene_type:complete